MRLRCAAKEQSAAAAGRAASATRCFTRHTRRAAWHAHKASARQQRVSGARTLHSDGDGERYNSGDERRPRRARRQLSAQRGARCLGVSALGAARRLLLLPAAGAWCLGRRRRRKARRQRDALGLDDARHAPPRRRGRRHADDEESGGRGAATCVVGRVVATLIAARAHVASCVAAPAPRGSVRHHGGLQPALRVVGRVQRDQLQHICRR